jgi:hypothetical protein
MLVWEATMRSEDIFHDDGFTGARLHTILHQKLSLRGVTLPEASRLREAEKVVFGFPQGIPSFRWLLATSVSVSKRRLLGQDERHKRNLTIFRKEICSF